MKKVVLSKDLKEKVPDYCLAVMSFEIKIEGTSDSLKDEIRKVENEVIKDLTLENLLKQPRIEAARVGYRRLGKDPSRYRLATEALTGYILLTMQ